MLDFLSEVWYNIVTAKGTETQKTVKGIHAMDYKAAEMLMDDDIREELHTKLAPCTSEEFLEAYKKAHFEKYGEEFIYN